MACTTELVDTHQHLVYPELLDYPWTAGIAALAGHEFTLDDYHGLTADKGIAATIFMEAACADSMYRDEARMVARLARSPASNIAGLIASCRPEDDAGFGAWLDECEGLGVVGFRRVLHVADDELSRSALFRRNVRAIGARGRPFDMCFLQRQLPLAAELAQACDNTMLMLDHCGVPDPGSSFADWQAGIDALAALPNVCCKLSGILAYCQPGSATLGTVRPYVEHVIEAFGADRVVWGSDWPVVNQRSSIADWIDISRLILGALSASEAALIGAGNARRFYNLPAHGGQA